jgi:hypothetical protein
MPTAAKSASNQGLRFMVYNEYKRFITSNRANKKYMTKTEALFGGMLAGFLGALGNTPFDTIKSRMQGLESSRYTGMLDCGKKMVGIFRVDFVSFLLKGLLMTTGISTSRLNR